MPNFSTKMLDVLERGKKKTPTPDDIKGRKDNIPVCNGIKNTNTRKIGE